MDSRCSLLTDASATRLNGSRNASAASSNVTPCCSTLERAFCSSHSKVHSCKWYDTVIRASILRRELVEADDVDQHVAGLGAVGGAQHAGGVQLVDHPRRAPVADAQPPLQQRGAPALVLDAEHRRLAEELVAVGRVVARARSAIKSPTGQTRIPDPQSSNRPSPQEDTTLRY